MHCNFPWCDCSGLKGFVVRAWHFMSHVGALGTKINLGPIQGAGATFFPTLSMDCQPSMDHRWTIDAHGCPSMHTKLPRDVHICPSKSHQMTPSTPKCNGMSVWDKFWDLEQLSTLPCDRTMTHRWPSIIDGRSMVRRCVPNSHDVVLVG